MAALNTANPKKVWTGIKSRPLCAVVALVLCFVYLYFFGYRALVQVELSLDSQHSSWFKIYWASGDDAYTESRSRQVYLRPNLSHYSVFLTNLGGVERLRVDPLEYPGQVTLSRFALDQVGYAPINLVGADALDAMTPVSDAKTRAVEGTGLTVVTTGRDGQLELKLSPERTAWFPAVHLVNLLLICATIFGLGSLAGSLGERQRLVTPMLLLVLVFTIIMAAVTDDNVHPDEKVHLAAVNWYGENFLPPRIDSPEIAHSFSGYGYSRLANPEIYYPAAGYFSRLFQTFGMGALLEARMLGLFMLAALLWMAVRSESSRVFILPLLLSAQAWYLFSYANSDGFALFMGLLASYQVACRESAFNNFLTDEQPHNFALKLLVFGAGAGVLLLLKTNFYFLLLFLGVYLAWRAWCGDFPDQRRFWIRLILIGTLGVGVFIGRMALDHAINGPNPVALRAEMIEKHSDPLYKPSTPLEKKHIYLYLSQRGFTLDRIINKEFWGAKTFLSAFGSFGFTQYFPPGAFYELIELVGLLLLGYLLYGILVHGPPRMHALVILMLGCAALLVITLVWRSWTVSFQAQGRYLAPILPMLGVLYYHARDYVDQRIVLLGSLAMFLLATYAFVFVGLHDIPKVDNFT